TNRYVSHTNRYVFTSHRRRAYRPRRTAMNQATVINGVDTDALSATINAIRSDPSIADFKFRVKNRWIAGGENRSSVDDYFGAKQDMRHAKAFELVNDEPPVLLSADKGP